ncbi:colanic acid biosynthesis acetyltransferase WcaF [Hyphomicrobium methylovorum]|uniref:WcaF family extracellular polysaccharide biosynthesis acetyltransferase n=1 Tax=Hyphomicrobium methylovorum TaxID=84 RepID=UPI0015E65F5A|nr:WcaF family extracellular polysaccharide biosynthesis acetyltransferase [Hyphomicrobium methylovorum]MBA2125504.1 colanic acid biosynthesis acetyltransferase WcaF [Hyphomicrobium methylovorum]
MRLDLYRSGALDRGRARWVEAVWLIVQWLFVRSAIPGSAHRRLLLRLFGAQIGTSVVIKPGLRVKFPWRLEVGDHTWLGEDVWIDNLAHVRIGAHCCVSQGAYLCTGSHDWASPEFTLLVRPISVSDHVWLAAKCIVGPGVSVAVGSILTLGSVATRDLAPWSIYSGTPALKVRVRRREADTECTTQSYCL